MNPRKSFARLAPALAAVLLPALAAAQTIPVAYVTNQATNVVHMFRTTDWTPLGNIPVGTSPTGIAIPTAGGFALVANKGNNTVSRIDLATSTVTATIAVPGNPTAVAIVPDGSKAYVVQPTNCPPPPVPTPSPTPVGPTPIPTVGPNPTPTPVPPCTLAVIDTASNTVTGNITVGHNPFAIAVSPSGGFVYVTNRDDDTVSLIDTSTDTVIDELDVADTPEGIFVGFGEVYVTNDTSESVSVYREVDFQPLATIPTGGGPLSIAVSPDGKTAVVGNDGDGTATIIDTGVNKVRATVATGSNPAGVAITPDSTRAVVTNSTAGSFSVVPLDGTAPTTISVLGSPAGVAITPAPYFVINKTALPAPVAAGGTIVYTITYENRGSANATGVTITDTIPTGLTFVSASNGGAPSGSNVVWTIGDLPIGGAGQIDATFTVDPLIPDGTVVTNTVTIADALLNSATDVVQVATRVPGGFGVNNATYYRKADGAKRDVIKFRAEFLLPTDFDNDGLLIAWTNASQILDVFTIPPGAFSHRPGTTRFRFNGYLGDGSRVLVRMNKTNDGYWKVSISHARLTLPLATDLNILVTGVWGTDLVASQRTFELKRSKPGTQKLFYRGIRSGGM
ncbi:DUF11 domain-containing protein [Candidatus Binatia bacterium]|nr:DUF11 domain-containing protein [Candidatus Binatia bacterium]